MYGKAIKFIAGNLDEDDLQIIHNNLDSYICSNQKTELEEINELTSLANHLTQLYAEDLNYLYSNVDATRRFAVQPSNVTEIKTLLQTEIYHENLLLENLKFIESLLVQFGNQH